LTGSASLPRRQFLAQTGALVAAAAVLEPCALAAASPVAAPLATVESLAIGFLPASAAGDPTAVAARVLEATRVRPESFQGQVEVTVHNLAGTVTEPLWLMAYVPATDPTQAPRSFRAAHRDASPASAAQPVRFRMPLDSGGGLSFALVAGAAGQETLLPFRLSGRTEPGATPLSRGTYFVVAADRSSSAPVDWAAYRIDLRDAAAGLQFSALHQGQPALATVDIAHAVISIRPL
jgi:hypothetical protein